MGLLAIPFPDIDPVAVELGPLAVKWYGLAYMAGLLLGWLYVKYLLRQDRLWPGGKAPFDPQKADDLLLFMTVGVLLGGRLGYVLFYEPRLLPEPPAARSSPSGTAAWRFHGALIGSIVAMVLFARRVGADPWSVMEPVRGGDAHGPVLRPAGQLHQCRAVGPAEHGAVGDGVSGRRARCRATRASSTRRCSKALVLFAVLWWLTHHRLALRRPGVVAGAFLRLRPGALVLRAVPRARPGHLLTVGPLTAGIFYSLPMIPGGIWMMRDRRAGARRLPANAQPAETRRRRPAAREAARAHPPRRAACPSSDYMHALPRRSRARLLAPARHHRRRRRLHHRARDQPGVRRADRPVVRGRLAGHGPARRRCASSSWGPAAAR